MNDDGYIKYLCNWNDTKISVPDAMLKSLNFWREKLLKLSLIGMYDDGIGFGNMSTRNADGNFFITGSATGGKALLTADDYALVQKWNFAQNLLFCEGKTKASSESLSHAAIYESDPAIRAVLHVHHEGMWNYYLENVPTTSAEISYGTPEMALDIKNLLSDKGNIAKNLVVMAGHKEGLLIFGKDLNEAGNRLLHYYNQSENNSVIFKPDLR